jgi:hypothetical protein
VKYLHAVLFMNPMKIGEVKAVLVLQTWMELQVRVYRTTVWHLKGK